MSSNKNQHVVPHPRGWAVKSAGGQCATSVHPTQSDAISAARDIAINNRSEMLIHRPDGRDQGTQQLRQRSSPTEGLKHEERRPRQREVAVSTGGLEMPTLGLNPVAGWERGGSSLEYRRS